MAAVAVTMEPGADGAMTVSRRGRAGRSLFWRQLAVAAGSKKRVYSIRHKILYNSTSLFHLSTYIGFNHIMAYPNTPYHIISHAAI